MLPEFLLALVVSEPSVVGSVWSPTVSCNGVLCMAWRYSYILLHFRPTSYILEGRKEVLYFAQILLCFLYFKEMSPIFLELCILMSKPQLLQQFQIKFLLLRRIFDHNIACLVFNFIANQYFPSCLMIHSCSTGTLDSPRIFAAASCQWTKCSQTRVVTHSVMQCGSVWLWVHCIGMEVRLASFCIAVASLLYMRICAPNLAVNKITSAQVMVPNTRHNNDKN